MDNTLMIVEDDEDVIAARLTHAEKRLANLIAGTDSLKGFSASAGAAMDRHKRGTNELVRFLADTDLFGRFHQARAKHDEAGLQSVLEEMHKVVKAFVDKRMPSIFANWIIGKDAVRRYIKCKSFEYYLLLQENNIPRETIMIDGSRVYMYRKRDLDLILDKKYDQMPKIAARLWKMSMASTSDITEMANITRPTLWQWRRDPDFPLPIDRNKHGLLYKGPAVAEWMVKTGRLSPKTRPV